ncbi:MAG: M14 family metallopeptidase [bacterium]
MRRLAAAVAIVVILAPHVGRVAEARAANAAEEAILPPALPWEGRSRSLVVAADDEWVTPSETSGLTTTPRYDETIAWLARLDGASDDIAMISIGKSPEGRDIWMVIASDGGAATPEALRATGRPTLLAQAGIHSGEIDGKDAGMMLLRDFLPGRRSRDLLRDANLLFIPIYNVDGHERFSPYGRINQRGPESCGWRTTASNLNLNRDYAKADAPETRAIVQVLRDWDPDLYYDIHVTDGIDYQYDITIGWNSANGFSPNAAKWLDTQLRPHIEKELRAAGHVPGPLIFALDNRDPARGIGNWTAPPRFSQGYGDARHVPSVLVENHSLKPYDQRVLGTYLLLAHTLDLLGERGGRLREATVRDRALRPSPVPVGWRAADGEPKPFEFLGVVAREIPSAVSGGARIEWTGRPVTLQVPYVQMTAPAVSVARPTAYWVPPAWPEVIDRLALHGIAMERIDEARSVECEVYALDSLTLDTEPFEGRVRVQSVPVMERRVVELPRGSMRVPTDQPLGDLAVLLLEPNSGDSFLQWGFFLGIMQETEYYESYVMEPMAERMLAQDAALRAEFDAKVASDSAFAANPDARLRWFYRRTPFHDERWGVYPVVREAAAVAEAPGREASPVGR